MRPDRDRARPDDPGDTRERRRIGVVVHDDRGNGRVEWKDSPRGVERTSLSVEDPQSAEHPQQGYDPYASGARAPGRPTHETQRTQRDLRQLSEWIKQVRRVEELKRAEDGESGDDDAQA